MIENICKLPPIEKGRVETGAVQFGDDWPGLFVRGDDCISLQQSIRRVLEALTKKQTRELATYALRLDDIAEMIETHVLA